MLPALLGEVEPDAIAKLITGIGDVDSTGIASRSSTSLGSCVDQPISRRVRWRSRRPARSARRVRPDDSSAPARRRRRFMYDHGGRGPNEWDIYQCSYETDRRCCCRRSSGRRRRRDDADPRSPPSPGAAERQRLIDKYEGGLRRQPGSARRVPDRDRRQVWMGPASGSSRANPLPPRGPDLLRRTRAADDRARPPRPRAAFFMLLADEVEGFLAIPARSRPGWRNASRTTSRSTTSSRRTSSTASCHRCASGSGAVRASPRWFMWAMC